jgi:archaemetzincin
MSEILEPGADRWIGIAAVDLCIPILTFVFGEAQLGGRCALVSNFRLHQEYYGLPPDPGLMRARLLKEVLHETGHMMGLTHCGDYACAMAASHSVELLDLKEALYCKRCAARMRQDADWALPTIARSRRSPQDGDLSFILDSVFPGSVKQSGL